MSTPPAENKTVHIHILMSPSEVAEIDDWGFAHRIRTRGAAMRMLVDRGLHHDDVFQLLEFASALAVISAPEGSAERSLADSLAGLVERFRAATDKIDALSVQQEELFDEARSELSPPQLRQLSDAIGIDLTAEVPLPPTAPRASRRRKKAAPKQRPKRDDELI